MSSVILRMFAVLYVKLNYMVRAVIVLRLRGTP